MLKTNITSGKTRFSHVNLLSFPLLFTLQVFTLTLKKQQEDILKPFESGGQSIKTLASASVLPMNIALEKKLKVLDFVSWLNSYYFVLCNCFPFSAFSNFSELNLLFTAFLQTENVCVCVFVCVCQGLGGLCLGRPCRVLVGFSFTW